MQDPPILRVLTVENLPPNPLRRTKNRKIYRSRAVDLAVQEQRNLRLQNRRIRRQVIKKQVKKKRVLLTSVRL